MHSQVASPSKTTDFVKILSVDRTSPKPQETLSTNSHHRSEGTL